MEDDDADFRGSSHGNTICGMSGIKQFLNTNLSRGASRHMFDSQDISKKIRIYFEYV